MAWRELLTSLDAWLLTIALAILFPAYGYCGYRRLSEHPDRVVPTRMKLRVYASVILSQWFLAAGMLLVLRRHGLALTDVGQRLGDVRLTSSVTGILLVFVGGLLSLNLRRLRRARPDQLAAAVRRLKKFLPTSHAEQGAFALMALTAGICEELLYRGWLVTFLAAGLGSIWASVLVGAAVFGIAHAYQGRKGILMTGVGGLAFGALFATVGSLVPGQVLHAVIDLASGYVGSAVVIRLDKMSGEPSPASSPAAPAPPG